MLFFTAAILLCAVRCAVQNQGITLTLYCNVITDFTFVSQCSTDKITKAFIVNGNMVSLLIRGHN